MTTENDISLSYEGTTNGKSERCILDKGEKYVIKKLQVNKQKMERNYIENNKGQHENRISN